MKKLSAVKISKPIFEIKLLLFEEHIQSELEYKFLTDRKFRFDLAIPSRKIAVEYEGGVFSKGRHTRGIGYANDCEKYNLAVLNDWRVLRYTIHNFSAVKVVEDILRLIRV